MNMRFRGPGSGGSVLYVALALARGHLMRAHLLRRLLASAGIEVRILTTSEEGRQFLAELGSPSSVLPGRFTLKYDGRQNLAGLHSVAGIAAYLASGRAAADWREIREYARDADLIVNDSLHPTLLLAPVLSRSQTARRILHLHAENMWAATARFFEGRVPKPIARAWRQSLDSAASRGVGQVVHSLRAACVDDPKSRWVHPIIARPGRPASRVRRDLGVPPGKKLAVVYLNPHFRDATLAEELEHVLRVHRYHVYAVGEGLADRPGWVGRDPHLIDAIAASDLVVSAPGMGTLCQVHVFGKPYLGIVTGQPEQVRNLRYLYESRSVPYATVRLTGHNLVLRGRLRDSMERIEAGIVATLPQDPYARLGMIENEWIEVFHQLIAAVRGPAVPARILSVPNLAMSRA